MEDIRIGEDNPPNQETEAHLRQGIMVPEGILENLSTTVLGVGSIGRQVALQLALIGVPDITLIDHDLVENHNRAAQGYQKKDLGLPKVLVTATDCLQSSTSGEQLKIRPICQRWYLGRSPSMGSLADAIFICVDSMATRKEAWDSAKSWFNVVDDEDDRSIYCDIRVGGETIRVLTVTAREHIAGYEATLFSDADSYEQSCTRQTTIYVANIAAGLMLQQLSLWMRNAPIQPDILLALASMELTLLGPESPAAATGGTT